MLMLPPHHLQRLMEARDKLLGNSLIGSLPLLHLYLSFDTNLLVGCPPIYKDLVNALIYQPIRPPPHLHTPLPQRHVVWETTDSPVKSLVFKTIIPTFDTASLIQYNTKRNVIRKIIPFRSVYSDFPERRVFLRLLYGYRCTAAEKAHHWKHS